MKKIIVVTLFSLLLLVPVYGKLISYVSGRALEEKIGYLPQKEIIKLSAMEYKSLISEWLFFKVIIYFGGVTDPGMLSKKKDIEYLNMFRFLDASTYIDPYNIDSYYFAQATFTWEIGKIKEVNYLLERGLKYRTWDFYPPFFLGFNNFYFLKEYKQASKYLEQAAKLTGDPVLTGLAARFLYEAEETEVAISFLKFMIENTWNQKVKQPLEVRLKALVALDLLEKGAKNFEHDYHRKPVSIEEMINNRIIDKVPEDPYGGKFYLDEKGKIRTTSKLAFGVSNGNSNKDRKSQ